MAPLSKAVRSKRIQLHGTFKPFRQLMTGVRCHLSLAQNWLELGQNEVKSNKLCPYHCVREVSRIQDARLRLQVFRRYVPKDLP